MQLFLCNLVNGRFVRRFGILALQGVRVTAGTQRQVSRLGVVVRVASRVARLVAALAGMRALAVAPRWPKQALQRGRRVLRRAFCVTQQGGAMMIGVRWTGDTLHILRGRKHPLTTEKEDFLNLRDI